MDALSGKWMDKEINDDIANFFLNDSREYLKRYELLKSIQTDIANRSKLLIDILFSFECSFKALIFLESTTDEKETYKIIKDCGHNLRRLIGKVDREPISDIVSIIDDNIEHFSISSRYTLEANIYFRNTTGVLDNLYYSTIANHIWLDDLYVKAKRLNEYVASKIDNSLKTMTFEQIDLEKEMTKTQRIKHVGQR